MLKTKPFNKISVRRNDVDFFLLDNRYYRSPNWLISNEKTMLGKLQMEWLQNVLITSKASFKFVVMGGPFLTTTHNYETYSNYGFAGERQEIINFIYQQSIQNVVFLTGDRHHTELDVLEHKIFPTIYDITISPLTSSPSPKGVDEKNQYRVDGTLVMERNFGVLEFSGKRHERELKIIIYDTNGKEIWTQIIEQE